MAIPSLSTKPLRAAVVVFPNEPCFELAEVNRVVPVAGEGPHRFQIVTVIRNDEKVVYEKDMGPSTDAEVFYFGGAVPLGDGHYEVLETVERLQAAADDARATLLPVKRLPPTDLKKGFEEFAVRRRDARVGRKQISMIGRKR